MNRGELITNIAIALYNEECLSDNFQTTDDLLDAVKDVIASELESVVLLRGNVL